MLRSSHKDTFDGVKDRYVFIEYPQCHIYKTISRSLIADSILASLQKYDICQKNYMTFIDNSEYIWHNP
jgi:hypothetical protein